VAAEANYRMFWKSLRTLLEGDNNAQEQLDELQSGFAAAMQQQLEAMWSSKLGLSSYDEALVTELLQLMAASKADYTKTFRLLCDRPGHPSELHAGFYLPSSDELDARWQAWLERWHASLSSNDNLSETSAAMRRVNPAITWREWLIAPAYQQAEQGDHDLVRELQELFSHPYHAPSSELAKRYDQLKPRQFFSAGGISHYSCSS
jgi:uncharacterized protein YdiU (UPF0061 family)